MNILITGGAGFIGSVVGERLIEEGHSVCVLDNFSNSYRKNIPKGAILYEADITDPETKAFQAAFAHKDLIIHCAAIADVQAGALECIQTNVIGGMNVMAEMARRGIKRIINASSAAVYGDKYTIPISERARCVPINDYGLSKLLFEYVLHNYAERYNIMHTSFRYFNVVGATENHGENRKVENHLIYRTLKAAMHDNAIGIHGDGTCVRDFVHVVDVAEAHVKVIEKDTWKNVYNIGSGRGHTVEDVVKLAAQVIGKDIYIKSLPYRDEDPLALISSIDKARDVLEWQPSYTIEETIQHTWEWLHRKESDAVN